MIPTIVGVIRHMPTHLTKDIIIKISLSKKLSKSIVTPLHFTLYIRRRHMTFLLVNVDDIMKCMPVSNKSPKFLRNF